MIIDLFGVILIISIVCLVLGYFTGDSHYAFVGLFFIFLLGIYIFTNNLEYETGISIVSSYNMTNGSLSGSSSDVVYNYSTFNDTYTRWFGVLLSVSSAFGMALMFWNVRKYQRLKQDED
jgi:hypothetical protein